MTTAEATGGFTMKAVGAERLLLLLAAAATAALAFIDESGNGYEATTDVSQT